MAASRLSTQPESSVAKAGADNTARFMEKAARQVIAFIAL
jgi:hypothetical protein